MNSPERRDEQGRQDGVVKGVRSTKFTPEEFRQGLFALARANPWILERAGLTEADLDRAEADCGEEDSGETGC